MILDLLKYIGIGFGAILLFYFLSHLQMQVWLSVIEKFLIDKHKQNEQTKKK